MLLTLTSTEECHRKKTQLLLTEQIARKYDIGNAKFMQQKYLDVKFEPASFG